MSKYSHNYLKKIINEEISSFNIKEFISNLSNGKYKIINASYGEKAYNYTTENGIEVTLKIDYSPHYLNGIEVSPDIIIDYIGNNNIKNRMSGLASSELSKIIKEADKHNISLGLEATAEGATHNIQGTETGKIGLNSNQLINWYKRFGFIFEYDSNFGYRPNKTDEIINYSEKEIQIPKQNINIDNIDFYSDPETFNDDVLNGKINDGYYEDGTDRLFLIKNGKKYLINNLKIKYSMINNKFLPNIIEI